MKTSWWDAAGKTDPGCVRTRNEDSLALEPRLGLFVVADGMGGHNSGEVASSLAVQTILEHARGAIVPGAPRRQALEACVQAANAAIFAKSRALAKDQGMGTTVVAVLADEASVTAAHVGDSRLYRLRRGKLKALTEDHSLVMDQVRHGLITQEQAQRSNLQNILTRALGTEQSVVVDVKEHRALPGDVFLLCSDGLTKMLPEPEIAKLLGRGRAAQDAAGALVEAARRAGGIDNITVVVARLASDGAGGLRRFWAGLFGK